MSDSNHVFVVSLSDEKVTTAEMKSGDNPDYADKDDISVTHRGEPDDGDEERIKASEKYIAYVLANNTERGR